MSQDTRTIHFIDEPSKISLIHPNYGFPDRSGLSDKLVGPDFSVQIFSGPVRNPDYYGQDNPYLSGFFKTRSVAWNFGPVRIYENEKPDPLMSF